MTPDEAIAKLKTLPEDQQRAVLAQLTPDERKGIIDQLKTPDAPAAAPEKKGFWQGYDETVAPFVTPTPHGEASKKTAEEFVKKPTVGGFLKGAAQETGTALSNIGAGGLSVLLHPYETAKGVGKAVLEASPVGAIEAAMGKKTSAQEMAEQFAKQPLETVETMAGQSAVMGAGGEVIPKVARGAVEAPKGVARFISKTGPDVTRDLVKDVKENREAVAKRAGEISTAEQTEAAGRRAKDEAAKQKHAEDVAKQTQKISTAEQTEAARRRAEDESATKTHEQKTANDQAKAKTEHEAAQKEFFRKKSEHEATTAKTNEENAKLQEDHAQKLEAHGKLQQGLNESERAAKGELRQVEDQVHNRADQMYKDLKPKLEGVESDPESTAEIVDNALDKFDKSQSKPAILERLEKLAKDNNLTYSQYDEFRSAISRELRKGTLPGSTYHLYQLMLEGDPETGTPGMIDEMERMAKTKGMEKEADAARASWREWAEAFRDRSSPLHSILDNPEEHGLLNSMRGQQTYLARLRSFGPEGKALAERIERDLNLAQTNKAQFTKYGTIDVPKPTAPKLGSVKPFTEKAPEYKPPPVGPKPKGLQSLLTSGSPAERAAAAVEKPKPLQSLLTSGSPAERATAEIGKPTEIGAEDVRNAKAQSMAKKAEKLSTGYSPLLTAVSVFDAFRNALEGNWKGVATDVAARGAYEIGKRAVVKMLENPKVIEILTKPTAEDIAQIPPDLRGKLGPILEVAQKQGIKVDPRVIAILGGTAPKTRVAAALTAQ